jgi:hypothetical protein
MTIEVKKQMEKQKNVYRKGNKFYIDNEFCMCCAQYHPIMEAQLCDGGWLYWYCQTCLNSNKKLEGIKLT